MTAQRRDVSVPTAGSNTIAWHCPDCGRMEDTATRKCPTCGEKRQRVSRFEWFLADALTHELTRRDRTFDVFEQWPLEDHRGFTWYFDLAVWVKGNSMYGGVTVLIEVDGSSHDNQKKYTGQGGGYTRDSDKHWEAFSNQRLHKQGYDFMSVPNEECRMRVVGETAVRLATQIERLADTYS